MNAFAIARGLTATIRQQTGTTVGIAVKQGAFAVTETRKENGRFRTEHLTPWQTHAECVDHMRGMVEGA